VKFKAEECAGAVGQSFALDKGRSDVRGMWVEVHPFTKQFKEISHVKHKDAMITWSCCLAVITA